MTRGMTRERFAEIKRQLDGAPDYAIAKELVNWIDNEGGLMDFDEPPKPVVIDGPGLYEVVETDGTLPMGVPIAIKGCGGGMYPWKHYPNGDHLHVSFGSDGVSMFGGVRLRKHVRPVVIDSPGRYWRKNVKTGAIDEANVEKGTCGPGTWFAVNPGKELSGYGCTYDSYGIPAPGPCAGDPWRIVAKVQTRQRPLTPDEAFKHRGKQLKGSDFPGREIKLHAVGESGVVLSWIECWGRNTGDVSFEQLAERFTLVDGSPLSVSEPIPFSEPSHDL